MLRADARRNRARVLEVAAKVFANEGLAVPIDEIASRAGVGIGTVYRQFPTKEALFAAIVEDRISQLAERAEAAAREPAPGDAFFSVLDRMIDGAAHKRDLVDALVGAGVDLKSTANAASTRMRKALAVLLRRAQRAGEVRSDVNVEELFALLGATFAAANRAGASAPRLFAIVRDGLRARA